MNNDDQRSLVYFRLNRAKETLNEAETNMNVCSLVQLSASAI